MIIVDTETTGINPAKNSIISIGALDFRNPQNQFYDECRIGKEIEVNSRALEINGFKEHELYDPAKHSLEKLMHMFQKWLEDIKDITIAGENPKFDRDFLDFSAKRYGLPGFAHRTIDLHTVAYEYKMLRNLEIPLKNNSSALSSDSSLNFVGLPPEPMPHHALVGAKLEAEAFSRLWFKKALFEEYTKYELPEDLIK